MTSEPRNFARHLRKHATRAEDILWQRLRGRRLGGRKFRRQVPLHPYIVDFLCIASKLVVELDGAQHAKDVAYDAQRTREIEAQGFTVIRFPNELVLTDIDHVLETIAAASSVSEGAPLPSPEWERGRG